MPAASCVSTLSTAEKFIRVPTCILRTLNEIQVDLFLWHNESKSHVLFRDAAYGFSRDRSERLADYEANLFVRARDFIRFSQHLSDILEQVLHTTSLSPAERFEALQFAVAVEIEHSLRMVKCDGFVEKARTIGQQIATLLGEEEVSPAELFDVVQHDSRRSIHLTSVAGYAVLLAKKLGIQDQNALEKIAMGGLLHDIGKRHIPCSILDKVDVLSNDEWSLIRHHAQRGYEELFPLDQLDESQMMMVYQHHERINGSGYPVRVTGEEIHCWAKILAITDVFEAITSKRPYRRAATKQRAVEWMESQAGVQFDTEMIQCWISAI